MAIRFAVLGPLSIEGGTVEIRSRVRRELLAILLTDADRPVAIELLVDRLWGPRPPAKARDNLYGYLSRLRSELAGLAALDRGPAGYTLHCEPSTVDLHLFGDLVGRARAAVGDRDAAGLYAEALALWRGPAFAGLDTAWLNGTRQRLDAERLAAALDRNDTGLRLGEHGSLLPGLRELGAEHPLDERIAGQLVLALHRSGRSAEALDHYRRLRGRLTTELGSEPGPALRAVHRKVLDDTADTGPADPSRPMPRQLPSRPQRFRGRADALKALDEIAGEPLGLIGGDGGIGKTWLALHWAHENLDRFPDGQLYADLRAFDPVEEPVAADEALRHMVTALGADAATLPDSVDAMTALFRSLAAGRRMLVLLDNVRDSAHVRPLLAGGSTTTLVTSRHELTGLVISAGAPRVVLNGLSEHESAEVLAAHTGAERTAAEPAAAAAIIAHCAGLPLALGIVAARAAGQPDSPLAAYAAELREGLDALDAGDTATSLRAVLNASFRRLDADSAEAFGLLGLAPGPDISLDMAAALFGWTAARARDSLRRLADTGLYRRHLPGRYSAHDLTRDYAAETAARMPADRRDAAIARLATHALHRAVAADKILAPQREPIRLDPPAVPVPAFDDEAAVTDWFRSEISTLTGLVALCASKHLDATAWKLIWAITQHLRREGGTRTHLELLHIGLTSAERIEDQDGMARMHNLLARAYRRAQRPVEARAHLTTQLELSTANGDRMGEGHTCLGLASSHGGEGDYRTALAFAHRALDLFTVLGKDMVRGHTLNLIAWYHVQLGEYDEAHEPGHAAISLLAATGFRYVEGSAWDTVGRAHFLRGEFAEAVTCHERARDLQNDPGDRLAGARILRHLGEARHAVGDLPGAREAWGESLALYTELDRSEAAELLALLAGTQS